MWKFFIALVFVSLVTSFELSGHEWACNWFTMCNYTHVWLCKDRECIDNICRQGNDSDWTMFQPWPEVQESCEHKYYHHEPVAEMQLIGVTYNGTTATPILTCDVLDDCLNLWCSLVTTPNIFRIYVTSKCNI